MNPNPSVTASTPATRLNFVLEEIQQLKNQHLFQTLRTLEGKQGTEIVLDGKKVLNFSSNNYLGFIDHPRLLAAAQKAITEYGVGSGAVRSIIGTLDIHQALEKKLAEFKKVEATLVLQSGFMANTAVITSIMGEGDVILSDALNHASIIDACRMLKAVPTKVFAHSDMEALETRLKETQDARRRLIITDGVFSMDGDLAKLPEIVALAEKYDAMVMVDDAHASGVFGRNGRGTVDHFDLNGRVDIQVGTLSKAIGALGGYVASSQGVRDLMINRARPFLFSTSHPPSVVMSCMAAIDVLLEEPQWMEKLWQNTQYFKEKMLALGFNIQSESPILPVIVGTSETAHQFSEALFNAGVYARAIVYPTVALDKAR
ncbi:MAG: glycine C-acetyltransferase, partial [Cyanobacteria bacterium]|nr:glycine C-acetyltransferase [Cyanobacteriota bacterium]